LVLGSAPPRVPSRLPPLARVSRAVPQHPASVHLDRGDMPVLDGLVRPSATPSAVRVARHVHARPLRLARVCDDNCGRVSRGLPGCAACSGRPWSCVSPAPTTCAAAPAVPRACVAYGPLGTPRLGMVCIALGAEVHGLAGTSWRW